MATREVFPSVSHVRPAVHCRPPRGVSIWRVGNPLAIARGTDPPSAECTLQIALLLAVLISRQRNVPFRSRPACRHACRGRISTASDSERVAVETGYARGRVRSLPTAQRFRSANAPRTVSVIADSSLRKDRSARNRSTVRGTLATARGSKNGDKRGPPASCTTRQGQTSAKSHSGSGRPVWPVEYGEYRYGCTRLEIGFRGSARSPDTAA